VIQASGDDVGQSTRRDGSVPAGQGRTQAGRALLLAVAFDIDQPSGGHALQKGVGGEVGVIDHPAIAYTPLLDAVVHLVAALAGDLGVKASRKAQLTGSFWLMPCRPVVPVP